MLGADSRARKTIALVAILLERETSIITTIGQ
jgi:hypothetical protein